MKQIHINSPWKIFKGIKGLYDSIKYVNPQITESLFRTNKIGVIKRP